VARVRIIGCGCRGLALARGVRDRGHAVRGTTRDAGRLAELEAAGVEAVLADPDRVMTITPAFEHVTVACILLGSAAGAEDHVRALHGTRLEMLLTKLVDTTVRAIIYEARGTVPADALTAGATQVRAVAEDSVIPYALLDADPARHEEWASAALDAVDRVLSARASAGVGP
jgi:uncharacterized protein YbjT (DUF2867 family)